MWYVCEEISKNTILVETIIPKPWLETYFISCKQQYFGFFIFLQVKRFASGWSQQDQKQQQSWKEERTHTHTPKRLENRPAL